MSFCQTRNRSTQSSKVVMRFAGMQVLRMPLQAVPTSYSPSACSLFFLSAFSFALLSAMEPRQALLEKRVQPLRAVFGLKTFRLLAALSLERALEGASFGAKQRPAHGANCQRRRGCEAPGHAASLLGQPFVRHHTIDNAEAHSLRSRDHLASIEYLRITRRPHQPRQKVGAAKIRIQSHLGKVLPEA